MDGNHELLNIAGVTDADADHARLHGQQLHLTRIRRILRARAPGMDQVVVCAEKEQVDAAAFKDLYRATVGMGVAQMNRSDASRRPSGFSQFRALLMKDIRQELRTLGQGRPRERRAVR